MAQRAGTHIYDYYTMPDGSQFLIDTDSDKYRFEGGHYGDSREFDAYVRLYIKNGKEPSKKDIRDYLGEYDRVINDKAMKNFAKSFDQFLKNNDSDLDSFLAMYNNTESAQAEAKENAREAALNAYYRDIYSTDPNTTGGTIYNNMVSAEQNDALANMSLADAQVQQAAMQQASTVKAITDQVKAERMARLRAGMSEAQIANQDMQTMMTNVNALNQQVNEANMAYLQAQQQYGLAQDTAYQQWLDNANAMSQSGAAYAASDAGDVYQQALRIANQTGMSFNSALKKAQGK